MSALSPRLTTQPKPEQGTGERQAVANAAAASFAALVNKISYLNDADIDLVRRAYRFADQAHLGQWRKSGEPYITHPIAVASQCAEWKLDAQALSAALLHDAMEDCGVTKDDLIEQFGPQVAHLVDGLTKLDKVQFTTREENQAESFRKMLLAMAKDIRVILIKLADRTHNMRTMGDMPRSKWQRIATETLEIYTPLAQRLGLSQTYRELQDLSFKYLRPWRYSVLAKAVAKARNRRQDLLAQVQQAVEASFGRSKLMVQVSAREKSLYSIYRKMEDKHLSFAQLHDVYGLRIVTHSVADCYAAIGVLHQTYKPVPGRFKDYIAIPKSNGYQSLHTTLVGPANVNIEFQVRTQAMDVVAETGIAAHWLYKATHQPLNADDGGEPLGASWLDSLMNIQSETRDATEFWENVKGDLFPDAIYVFSPKGRIVSLPRGATVIDYAYAIHSDLGDHSVSARINGQQVPLRSEIKNGDVVEMTTDDDAMPNPDWLSFVRTGRARSSIRHQLKNLAQSASVRLGERLLARAMRAEGFADIPTPDHPAWAALLHLTGNRDRDELFADIGMGKRIANLVAKRLVESLTAAGDRPDALVMSRERFTAHEAPQSTITLDGSESSSVKYASCCRPIPGDAIVGYLGRGEGLVIHTEDCAVARRLRSRDAERFVPVVWSEKPTRTFDAGIVVTVANHRGVLANVTTAVTQAGADIEHLSMTDGSRQDAGELRLVLAVADTSQLDHVMRQVSRLPSVLRVQRIKPAAAGD
ncbi:guanosine-3',5'-bis(diphosphate) 3'-pyrophosphohydrolase [Comamonas serinivorans]|uniref:Guanosine-3',5'-bis(Diphosphate) 3'-pyrophosphohydrolase n=1 Tax=Comamonas serinivorans TaxID=1082851 RepID=A0A1Y0EPY6_9BURK|nr:bifunctional (p)ppGpp synthetase/guanosine-3',5'-bis(diphosphate) 3'-pyrophosphohydrolase [Comamonas serinivorans]ARU05636.1 guanosine-3',5'-bis(diphosphate) 3'-pyrophosphohydrolase [Comamonas serinivorans]